MLTEARTTPKQAAPQGARGTLPDAPQVAFYDADRSYEDNYEHGPFGEWAGSSVYRNADPEGHGPQEWFLGRRVWAQLGIPAGPLLNGCFVRAALDAGFDIPVYKTVRTRAYRSHPWPNVLPVHVEGDLHPGRRLVAGGGYVEPLSITNSFGVPSMAPDVWQPDMAAAAAYARPGQMVVGSFQGTLPETGGMDAYLADFRTGARLVRETGVHAVEVNLSCPNEGTAHLLCFDVGRARRVVEAVQEQLNGVPLIIKIAYFASEDMLGQFLRSVGPLVQGIAAINTVSAEVVDANGAQALPGAGRLSSGVCGSAIRWAGLEMTSRLVAWREELALGYAVVGVGGLSDADAFAAYRAAGADAAMTATAAMWNPRLAQQIKQTIQHSSTAAGHTAGPGALPDEVETRGGLR